MAASRQVCLPFMPPPPVPPNLARLVLLAIAAEGMLTLMDAMIKGLSPRYPTFEIAFLRYAFAMIGATFYAIWTRPGWPTQETTIHNSLRALLIVVIATSFFFALRPTGTSQRDADDEDERAAKAGSKCRASVSDRTEHGGCNGGDGPDRRQNAQVHTDTLSSSG